MAKTQIPEDFGITDEMRMWAKCRVPQVDIDAQHEVFMDYWKGCGREMADWVATWRNWMRRAPQFSRSAVKSRWKPEGLD